MRAVPAQFKAPFAPQAPVTAQVTAPYTITGSTADVPGMSISLTPGLWQVVGVFDFAESGAGDVGNNLIGTLATTGGSATITFSNAQALWNADVVNGRVVISQTWYVNVVATATVKGQAIKSAGTGASVVAATNSVLMAFNIG